MAPSISEGNNSDLNVAGSATEAAPAKEENHENPTVQGGSSLMWSEGSMPVSSESGLYIVTSDYDSADDSAAEPSPCSRPHSEAGFSVCSSSADLPVPEEYPQAVPFLLAAPAVVGVFDEQGDFQHLQFTLQGDNVFMYPPPMYVPHGAAAMPHAGVPYQMQVPHTAAGVQQVIPSEGAAASSTVCQPHPGMVYSTPQQPMMGHGQQFNNEFMSPIQSPPLQGQPPMQGRFQSPAPEMMYTTPPPTVSPMGLPVRTPSAAAEQSKVVNVATMPMPKTDQNMSVGTRNGPMVLFATAPGASEMTIEVPGMSGYPDSVSQQ